MTGRPLSPGSVKEPVAQEGIPFPVHLSALGSSFKGRELGLKPVRRWNIQLAMFIPQTPRMGPDTPRWLGGAGGGEGGVKGRVGGGRATPRVRQTGKATSAGRCPSPRPGHWVMSPAEGAVLLKEQGSARPLEGDVGATQVWLLADQRQRWGV